MSEQQNDVIEQTTTEGRDEYKTLVSPNFTALMYEVETYLHNGWVFSKEMYPHFNYVVYEVHLERNARTLQLAKERLEAGQAGRQPFGTDERRANMAKARETLKAKRAEKKGGESEDQV
jgi:hypothetical protein